MKAGVAQIALSDKIDTNMKKLSAFAKQAADFKLDILCFPECSLTGYMQDFHDIRKGDIEMALGIIHEQAVGFNLNLLVGTPYFDNDSLFNAAVLLKPDNSRTVYFKNMLTEFDQKYFLKGEGTLSFEIKGIKCGVLICRDQNFPELARLYTREGAKAIFFLAAHYYPPAEAQKKFDKNRALPIARAVENGVYVLKANAVGSQDATISLGGSLVVSPEGSVICEADKMTEDILYCDID
ncbi:MAG: carbon-nitrogen hydrolase family protein [Chloroflexota bacterium]|nr:carbon-nitrogen hydrolase family protein [Chloroflexota bacterium]